MTAGMTTGMTTGLRLTHPATPYATMLRVRPGAPIRVGTAQEPTIALRIEVPEVWDVVRIDAPPSASVHEIKLLALEALYPTSLPLTDFVIKRDGWEVRDEGQTLQELGARDGTIFLLTFRERRPVRV
jgi:hypothetical protein